MEHSDNLQDQEALRRERNTYRISLATGILLLAISLLSTWATIASGLYSFSGIAAAGLVGIAAFVAAWESRRGRALRGSGILIGTLLIASLSLPFVAQGVGFAIAAMVFILVSGLAAYTLPPYWSVRAVIAGVVMAIYIMLADLYLPDLGIKNEPVYSYIFGAILSVIYGAIVVRRFAGFTLRTKLIVSFMAVSIIPIAILGFQSYQNTYSLLVNETNASLLNSASLSADSISSFLETELDTIRTDAQLSVFPEFLATPSINRSGSIEEERVVRALQSFLRRDPVFISSYALLDRYGVDLIDTLTEDMGLDKSGRDYFQEPMQTGLPFVSAVRTSPTTSEMSIYFSAPIRDSKGDIIGVLRVRYSASIIQSLLDQSHKSNREKSYLVLVDRENHIRLAHTNAPELNFTTYKETDLLKVQQLQDEGLLKQGAPSDVVLPLPGVPESIDDIENHPIFTGQASVFGGAESLSAGSPLTIVPWVALAREPVTIALAPVKDQTRALTLLSLLIGSLAAIAAVAVSQVLSQPVTNLTQAAEQIAAGNLAARATVATQDEIGTLAAAFNNMTSQLQQTLTGLEQSVSERTADLRTAIEQTEKRARELQTIAELSRAITTQQDIDQLLPLVTRLVSERFGFYHTGIFLLDESQRYAVLRAANSEGGQRMLARQHKLEVGQVGIVGYVSQSGRARVALDVGDDAVFFNNPDLPSTRSEMALPLLLHGQVIGVLDVQSEEASAFTQADATTLSVLADQIATAIENARLFGASQKALAESQNLYRQFVSREWERISLQKKQIGFYQTLSGGRELEHPMESRVIDEALTSGEAITLSAATNSDPVMAIPIKIRDQIIGVLNIRAAEKSHRWSEDEIAFAQAVAGRVALALENARLVQDSQRRALKERTISEISARINASSGVEEILRTTVAELGRTLGNSNVIVQFTQAEEED